MKQILRSRCAMGFILALALSPAALSQEETRQETVVVTANYIDSDADVEVPNATLKVRADFVIFELTFVNATLDLEERANDMRKMFDRVVRKAADTDGISLRIGEAERSASVETSTFDEVYLVYGNRGQFSFVLQAETSEADRFEDVRSRVEAFVTSINQVGRSESYMGDEQFIGVHDLKAYRAALIEAIWSDIYKSAGPLRENKMRVSGLHSKTRTRPSGPLELEIYIPYSVEYETGFSPNYLLPPVSETE